MSGMHDHDDEPEPVGVRDPIRRAANAASSDLHERAGVFTRAAVTEILTTPVAGSTHPIPEAARLLRAHLPAGAASGSVPHGSTTPSSTVPGQAADRAATTPHLPHADSDGESEIGWDRNHFNVAFASGRGQNAGIREYERAAILSYHEQCHALRQMDTVYLRILLLSGWLQVGLNDVTLLEYARFDYVLARVDPEYRHADADVVMWHVTAYNQAIGSFSMEIVSEYLEAHFFDTPALRNWWVGQRYGRGLTVHEYDVFDRFCRAYKAFRGEMVPHPAKVPSPFRRGFLIAPDAAEGVETQKLEPSDSDSEESYLHADELFAIVDELEQDDVPATKAEPPAPPDRPAGTTAGLAGAQGDASAPAGPISAAPHAKPFGIQSFWMPSHNHQRVRNILEELNVPGVWSIDGDGMVFKSLQLGTKGKALYVVHYHVRLGRVWIQGQGAQALRARLAKFGYDKLSQVPTTATTTDDAKEDDPQCKSK